MRVILAAGWRTAGLRAAGLRAAGLWAAGLWACGDGGLRAQAVTTLKVETHLIETTFTVRDAQDHPVTGLSRSEFSLAEDGVLQTVRYFATQREQPLSIGLLIDASGSQDKFTKEHERELRAFLEQVMTPADRAFAVCFGNHLRLVSDWTAQPTAVLDAVQRFHKGARDAPELGPPEERDLGTALDDAVYYAAGKLAVEVHRRRILLLFTDGQENASAHDDADALEQAEEGDVLVYAIRTTAHTPEKWVARDRYGERVLKHLTAGTGGTVFDARTTSAEQAFASIAADLRSLYDVGYYSTNTVRDHRFHSVTVAVKQPGGTVRARLGYTAR